MSYPEPRRVVLALADVRRCTILERARACGLAAVDESEIAGLLDALMRNAGTADQLERGVLLLYAIALQLERRNDPALTWQDAQSWDLALDLDGKLDASAEAEARASVEAAIATGLPPAVAGELTLAQLDVYREAQKAAQKKPRRRASRRAG